jgi:hypothetical protein
MGSCHVSLFYAILRKNSAFIYIYDMIYIYDSTCWASSIKNEFEPTREDEC